MSLCDWKLLKRQGVTKGSWFLQKTPQGDMVIVYFEAFDVENFDAWFKQVKSVTRVDLEQPSDEPLPKEIFQARIKKDTRHPLFPLFSLSLTTHKRIQIPSQGKNPQ